MSDGHLYIVTKAHNLDYISSTCYLTRANSGSDAIRNCLGSLMRRRKPNGNELSKWLRTN